MVAFPQWPEPLRDLALERQRRPLSQGAILEGERNDTLFRLGCSLRGAGKSEAEIHQHLEAENQARCCPPLLIADVAIIAGSAARYEPDFHPFPSRPLREGPGTNGLGMVYHTQTIQELISQSHDVEWLVDGVLPRDGVLLITGEAGIGKTWMVLALAMALDGGKPWLDEFSTIATKVLMIDEESSPSLLKDRFQKLKAQTSGTLMLVGAGVMLDDDQRYDALEDLMEREQPGVVVMDSLVRFHGADENHSGEMAKVNGRIDRLRRKHNCAFVICHHRKKPGMGPSDPANAFRGSSEIKAFPDVHIDIQRGPDGPPQILVSMPKCRQQEAIDPFMVEIVDLDDGRTVVRHLGPVVGKAERRTAQCQEFVEHLLSDFQPRYRQDVVEIGHTAGFSRQQLDDALKGLPPAEYAKESVSNKARYQRVRPEDMSLAVGRERGVEPIDQP